jgi:sugar lactone lactonase YvrE
MSFEETVAFDVHAELGEGALWDWRHGTLISVDLLAGRLLVSDPRDSSTRAVDVGQPVGAAMLQGQDELLLAVRDGFATLDLGTGVTTALVRVEAEDRERRMNDAACDPRGRCVAGTMRFDSSGAAGSLYRLDHDLSVHVLREGLSVSNGIGWSPSGDAMYHIDSHAGGIDAFDYDAATGMPSGRRRLADTDPAWGLPDGLAVDAEGGIWVAFWDGARVRRFDPSGAVTHVVELPAARPTRPAFGGPGLDRLYVTSAMLDAAEERAADGGGAIYVIDPGVRGLPAPVFPSVPMGPA